MKTIDLIKPDIYDDFQCKGAACRRTCCKGWMVTVSKAEYQDLKEKLNRSGDKILRRLPKQGRSGKIYGEFILEDEKGCPLQSDEGLCRLQLSLGPEALPDVCSFFPRKGLRCSDQMQLSLTPACEKVLELLLEKEGSLEFIRQKGPLPQMLVEQFSKENEKIAWNHHMKLQEFCILLLQAKDASLDHRMALLGLGLHQLDGFYKGKEYHKTSKYIDHYLTLLSQTEHTADLLPDKTFTPTILLGMFLSSTAFSKGYSDIVDMVQKELQVGAHMDGETGKITFTYSTEEYRRRRKSFAEFTDRHPFFLENLMVMLFLMKDWASMPTASASIWEQFMYACWVYGNLKFVLTSCIETVSSDEDLLDLCVVLLRSWIHNEKPRKKAIQYFHETGCDTPAHMAMLVQAG